MSLGRRLLLGALLAVVAGILVVGWMSRHSFRRVPVPEEVGLHGEALENATLLLQKWLEASGRAVARKGGEIAAKDLPEQGTLFLLHLDHPISQGEVEVLLAWARRGGHLLADSSAPPFNDERGLANLHKALGVTLRSLQPEAFAPMQTVKDTFEEGETPYQVRRSARWRLSPAQPDDWSFRLGHDHDQSRVEVLITRAEGEGRITLVADFNLVYRENLQEEDHAAFLERVLSFRPDAGPVVVWSQPVKRSLFQWIWTHGWPAVVALLALVAAWVWKGWPRLGPMLPNPTPQRRSLLEHLSASARLVWKEGSGAHLVARARAAVERRAQRRNPAFDSLALGDRSAWLAEATGGDADAIAAALDDRPGRPPQSLAQDLFTLVRLRQRL